ncbi:hypothetical protein [Dolichospermum sp. UHCC 0259]|uniref:hypothetical protein n=1 Tax=Dolichospermum sp. UHCC 0259 TaxID=2590010 RepID=UPI0014476ED0|nr:hypothetical protein [Dolichospermum sp. UHCC 0259]MTJ50667.1 hypothetical protein [Dolichospermum sp. UHCC 0259]
MLTTIAKRVQTRLSKQGVKVSLSDIRPVVNQSIKDIENPTDQEIASVVNYFLSTANQLTVVDDVDTVDTINTAPIQEYSDLYIEEDIDSSEAIAPPTENAPAPLATTNKSELITSAAHQMGIVLNASEISLIAENISNSSDDFDQDIDSIKAAIMAFIQHKSMLSQSKINQMIHEVREIVSEKNTENSQLLSEGLKQINSDIQEANRAFKSNVEQCLTAFDIPALKAS